MEEYENKKIKRMTWNSQDDGLSKIIIDKQTKIDVGLMLNYPALSLRNPKEMTEY